MAHLESQIPTWAFTLVRTSDQFRSSWRSGPNHTPRMQTGPGRVLLPLQAPSRKPSLLSKLTLAPAIRSYSTITSFTAFISRRRDTNTVMSWTNAETLAVRGPAKGIPRRAGLVPSSLSPRRKSFNARTQRRGDRGQPCRAERSIANTVERLLFTCTTVVHHANPSAELRFESGSLQNSRQKPMVNPIEGLGLI